MSKKKIRKAPDGELAELIRQCYPCAPDVRALAKALGLSEDALLHHAGTLGVKRDAALLAARRREAIKRGKSLAGEAGRLTGADLYTMEKRFLAGESIASISYDYPKTSRREIETLLAGVVPMPDTDRGWQQSGAHALTGSLDGGQP